MLNVHGFNNPSSDSLGTILTCRSCKESFLWPSETTRSDAIARRALWTEAHKDCHRKPAAPLSPADRDDAVMMLATMPDDPCRLPC